MFNKNIISYQEHFAFVENLLTDTTSRHFLVSQDEKFVGVVNLKDIDWINKSASFGIYANLLKKVTMAGEKLMVSADFIIKKMGLSSISLVVDSRNHMAKGLYERWGYEIVGNKEVNGLQYINYEKRYV
jgi:UDP-4-amino-4,6-dideoxy-N-acetyl-beta-L-altrosamine N-acetyltransferase